MTQVATIFQKIWKKWQYRNRSIVLYKLFIFSFEYCMTLTTFSSSGMIPREIDKFIKCVNGSRYESVHCFRIDAGSSSLPEAEFVIADMIVLTSSIYISGI